MPSQVRDVRPFLGLAPAEELLKAFRLTVSPGSSPPQVLEPGDSFVQEMSTYLTTQVVLSADASLLSVSEPSGDNASEPSLAEHLDRAAESAGLASDDLVFVVLVTSPRLRLAEVVETVALGDAERFIDGVSLTSGPDRPDPMRAPFGGCSVSVALCLDAALDASVPLRPWRRGTWLARSEFRLSTSEGTTGFTPIPLSDEDRKRMGLPAGTVRYVEIDSPLVDSTEAGDLRLWVDEDLLALLAKYPTTAAAMNLQRQLFLDAVQAILLRAVQDDSFNDLGESELEGTLLGRVLVAAGGSSSKGAKQGDLSEPLQLLKANPAMVLARIENRVGKLKDGMKQALVVDDPEEAE
jgi:hypothetical protein